MDDEIFARLVSIKDNGQDGSALPLKTTHVYVIGRGLSADFKILDASVRSNHCSIDFIEGIGPRIFPSKDAVVSVNGEELDGQIILSHGDIITMGSKTLRIDVRKLLPERSTAPSLQEPQPLLVDLISPPRINKVTVRAKTKNRSLIASTKPRGKTVTQKDIRVSQVKRQLFEQENTVAEDTVTAQEAKTSGRRSRRQATKTVSFQV